MTIPRNPGLMSRGAMFTRSQRERAWGLYAVGTPGIVRMGEVGSIIRNQDKTVDDMFAALHLADKVRRLEMD